ncbi:MAG: NHL repeat-containing protein [Candidatus Acidiferrales bacterium]
MRLRFILILAGLFTALAPASACRRQPDPPPETPPPPLEYIGEWGVKGNAPGELSRPVSLATDSAGNVYIADAATGFAHKFDPLGHPLLAFQDPALGSPDGIAVDRGGAIYVADAARSTILIFYPDGARFRQIRCAHRAACREHLGVAVDDDGDVFAVEQCLAQIQKFTPRGRLLKAWRVQGENHGQSPSLAGAAIGPDGFLYVVDAKGRRIHKFTPEGELVSAWGQAETSPEQIGALGGIAVSEKYVFATDEARRRVHVWTLDGRHKLSDDLGGRLSSGSTACIGVAVSRLGELLVLDSGGARVMRFRINF